MLAHHCFPGAYHRPDTELTLYTYLLNEQIIPPLFDFSRKELSLKEAK